MLGSLISWIILGLDKMYVITAIISGILIALCAILSGSLVSGNRMRANYNNETREDRLKKDSFTTNVS